MTAPLTFGRKAADSTSSGGHELFLKTFREKRTPVTFLWDNPKSDFYEVREHFDRKEKLSFPCAKSAGGARCIGCDYPVNHPEWDDAFIKDAGMTRDQRKAQDPGWEVRDTSGKWIVPVIDEKGYVSLYKIGFKFWKHLQGLYEELGSITNQVFTVLKTGETFNDIAYSAMPTGKPAQTAKENATVPGYAYVEELLGGKYLYALQKYIEVGLTNEDGTPTAAAAQPEPTAAPVERTGDPVKDAIAAAKAQAAQNGDEAQQPVQGASGTPAAPPEGWDPTLNAREASAGELKDWLDNRPEDRGGPVEYGAKAPRSVLVGLVEKAQVASADQPGF